MVLKRTTITLVGFSPERSARSCQGSHCVRLLYDSLLALLLSPKQFLAYTRASTVTVESSCERRKVADSRLHFMTFMRAFCVCCRRGLETVSCYDLRNSVSDRWRRPAIDTAGIKLINTLHRRRVMESRAGRDVLGLSSLTSTVARVEYNAAGRPTRTDSVVAPRPNANGDMFRWFGRFIPK